MIAPETHPAWARLIKGERDLQFKQASVGMMMFNLRLAYKRDPASLENQIKKAVEFFKRYESVMQDDLQKIFGAI